MNEEAKEAPKVENNPAESTAGAPKPNISMPEDTPSDRTVCTVFLVIGSLMLFRAVINLIEYRIIDSYHDHEGLNMMIITADWLIACVCDAIVIGKSLGRLKWMFYKVTMALSLIIALAAIVFFFFMQ